MYLIKDLFFPKSRTVGLILTVIMILVAIVLCCLVISKLIMGIEDTMKNDLQDANDQAESWLRAHPNAVRTNHLRHSTYYDPETGDSF